MDSGRGVMILVPKAQRIVAIKEKMVQKDSKWQS